MNNANDNQDDELEQIILKAEEFLNESLYEETEGKTKPEKKEHFACTIVQNPQLKERIKALYPPYHTDFKGYIATPREYRGEIAVTLDDFVMPQIYNYDEKNCQVENFFAVLEEDANEHHRAFLVRNEKFREMQSFLLKKAEIGILTSSDLDEVHRLMDRLNAYVWENHLKAFGIAETQKMFSGYSETDYKKSFDEIKSTLNLTFYKHLGDYNPYYTAPTTFFNKKFMSSISEYKYREKQNTTPYYAKQRRAIIVALSDLIAKYGITPDRQTLQEASGLSPKAFENAMKHFHTTKKNSFDNENQLSAGVDYVSPEAAYIETEKKEVVHAVLEECLSGYSEEEQAVFETYIEQLEDDVVSYKDIAQVHGMSMSKARGICSKIRQELQNNIQLQAVYQGRIKHFKNEYMSSVSTATNEACDVIQKGILASKKKK